MNKDQTLKAYLESFQILNDEDVRLFMEITHVRRMEAGEKIVQEGKVHSHVHFLLDGLIRAFQIKDNGDERTLWIGGAGAHLADPSSLLSGSTSYVNMEAIEPILVATFSNEEMEALEAKRPNILRFKCISLQWLIKELYERVHFLNMLTPQERFAYLSVKHPDYFGRIQQKHLASYIGVSEVHMSRLKKQFAIENK